MLWILVVEWRMVVGLVAFRVVVLVDVMVGVLVIVVGVLVRLVAVVVVFIDNKCWGALISTGSTRPDDRRAAEGVM